ncbi:DNA repair protein SWI5 homolog [Tachypleus tridentatus]|uniref:DNA repair protein SWI5 homolog n=1 Tax=Tachypleus tridentatus TaxID=6853 RepID=UPI003FCFDFDB
MKSNNESPKQTSVLTAEEVKERISLLEKRNQEIDLEIELLQSQGFKVEELQWHIDKLHEYNEIKDAAQCIIRSTCLVRWRDNQGSTRKIRFEYG